VFNNIPGTITVYSTPTSCNPIVSFLASTLDSNGGRTFSFNLNGATFANGTGTGTGRNFNVGTTHVTVNATNTCGSTLALFDIKVLDTLKPIINGLSNITVNSDANCGANVNYGTPTLTDNCPGCSYSAIEALGFYRMGDFNGHTYFRTPNKVSWQQADTLARSIGGYLVTVNNAAEDSFINVNTPDTMRAWIGLTDRDTEGVFKWVNGETTTATYRDFCGGQPDNWLGSQNYVMIHSDVAHGARCWDDAHSPVVPVLNISTATYGIIEMNTCNVTPGIARIGGPASGGRFPIGTTVVTYQATDGSGNASTGSFTVTVKDTMRPVFTTIVKDITTYDDGTRCGAVVTYTTPGASDLCPTCNLDTLANAGYVKLGVFDGHTYFRTPVVAPWEQADSMARKVGGYLVAINSLAENIFVSALVPDSVKGWIGLKRDSSTATFRKWTNGDSLIYTNWCFRQPDNWMGNQNYGLIHSKGIPGATQDCWDDAHSPIVPVLNIPNNFYGIVEMEDCGTTVVRTSGLSSGSLFPLGTTTVSFTATDASGNVTTVTFNVTVKDSTKPVFAPVSDTTVDGDSTRCGRIVYYKVPTAFDLCSACSTDSIINAGYKKIGEFGGKTYLLTPARGSWTDADSMARGIGGNLIAVNDSAENAFMITNVPDSITAWIGITDHETEGTFKWSNGDPVTFTYWCSGQPDNWLGAQDYGLIHSGGTSGRPGCWDDAHSPLVPGLNIFNRFYGIVELPTCGARVARVSGPQSGGLFPVGTTTVTYKAVDGSGNTSTVSFKVTVKDKQRPVAICKNVTLTLTGGTGTLTADSVNNGSFDACTGIASKSVSKTTFTASDLPAVVTLTVTDSNGNTATCTSTVTARVPRGFVSGGNVNGNAAFYAADIKVYPNPTSSAFFVEVPYSNEVTKLTLMDIQGKVLEVVNLGVNEDHKVRFDLQSRAKGMYMVEVTYGDQRFHSKIVHQ
jgi:hypothetical protein